MNFLLLAVQASSVTSVMNGIGNGALDPLWELLLQLLRDYRGGTATLRMRLVGGLAWLRTGGVDLK